MPCSSTPTVDDPALDGADPRPPPEGDLTAVDRVVHPGRPDVRQHVLRAGAGTWFEVVADRPADPIARYGHALALSPDGTRLASVGAVGDHGHDLDGPSWPRRPVDRSTRRAAGRA